VNFLNSGRHINKGKFVDAAVLMRRVRRERE
jgi:hypothetical protein